MPEFSFAVSSHPAGGGPGVSGAHPIRGSGLLQWRRCAAELGPAVGMQQRGSCVAELREVPPRCHPSSAAQSVGRFAAESFAQLRRCPGLLSGLKSFELRVAAAGHAINGLDLAGGAANDKSSGRALGRQSAMSNARSMEPAGPGDWETLCPLRHLRCGPSSRSCCAAEGLHGEGVVWRSLTSVAAAVTGGHEVLLAKCRGGSKCARGDQRDVGCAATEEDARHGDNSGASQSGHCEAGTVKWLFG